MPVDTHHAAVHLRRRHADTRKRWRVTFAVAASKPDGGVGGVLEQPGFPADPFCVLGRGAGPNWNQCDRDIDSNAEVDGDTRGRDT